MDVLDRDTRSRVMAAIPSRGNRSTELTLARALRRSGVCGWRRHLPILGRPDFAWPREGVAVFVDGCFWHGCHCRRAPKSNTSFWSAKIAGNRKRDVRVSKGLMKAGWGVVRIKECSLRSKESLAQNLKRIVASLNRARRGFRNVAKNS